MADNTTKHHHHRDYEGNWWANNWRPVAAAVYLVICACDFTLMPILLQVENSRADPVKIVELATQFKDGAAQIGAIHELHEQRTWQPLTLGQGGLFHVAFGAILSVTAYTRGREKEARIKAGAQVDAATAASAAGVPPMPVMQTMATTVATTVSASDGAVS